jgi:uncharacterized membrane protein YhfC
LYVTYSLNFILMIALPVALWLFLWWRWRNVGFSWRLIVAGALTFIASQLVRLPLLAGATLLFQTGALPAIPPGYSNAFNLAVLSLTAGLFEEGARYIGYRFAIKDARTWRQGVTYGAGHGGLEAILLGVLVALTFANMVVLQSVDATALPIPEEQRAVTVKAVAEFWSQPWYLTVLGAVERALALTLHITLSVVVLQSVVRGNLWWLLAAIVWHGLTNLIAVGVLQVAGPLASEAALAVIAAINLWALFRLRKSPLAAPGMEPASAR